MFSPNCHCSKPWHLFIDSEDLQQAMHSCSAAMDLMINLTGALWFPMTCCIS